METEPWVIVGSAAPLGTAAAKSLAAGQSMTIFEKAGATSFDLEL